MARPNGQARQGGDAGPAGIGPGTMRAGPFRDVCRRGEERNTPMPPGVPVTNVVVLGSTGSVGRSALRVIADDGGARLRARGLSAHSRWGPLIEQARTFRPR